MNQWWVLHDQDLRNALNIVADDAVTPDEVYAVLNEHSAYHPDTPNLRITTREDTTTHANQDEA